MLFASERYYGEVFLDCLEQKDIYGDEVETMVLQIMGKFAFSLVKNQIIMTLIGSFKSVRIFSCKLKIYENIY